MKKFWIIFISSLFIIAIVIRMCNGGDSYEDEDYAIDIDSIESPEIADPLLEKPVKEIQIDDTTTSSVELDTVPNEGPVEIVLEDSSVEIPRIVTSKPSQILKRAGYTTSYNNKTKNANWVAWHLTREHSSGGWSRDGIPYMVDYDVKGSRQELEDWNDHALPIDHGHLCPAGDCKWSKEAMEQSFLLTNICPQNSSLNRGDWEELESRCRGWARHYGEIYIATGPIFYNENYQTIGRNKVGVPDAFFKVVLCMGKKPKSLGFIYPNEGTSHNIQHYVTTVDKVEEITGMDFFYNLPDDIENAVESISNFNKW